MDGKMQPNSTLGQEASAIQMDPEFCLTLLFMADQRRDEVYANQQPGQRLYIDTERFKDPQASHDLLELVSKILHNQQTIDEIPLETCNNHTVVQAPGYVEVETETICRFNVNDFVKLVANDPELADQIHQVVMQCLYLGDADDATENSGDN